MLTSTGVAAIAAMPNQSDVRNRPGSRAGRSMSDLIRHARWSDGTTSWGRRDQLDAPAGQRATIAGHRLRLLPRRDPRRRRLWICERASFVFFSFLIGFLIGL